MHNFKILVVDDEAEFRNVYRIMLEYKGYEVIVATSGEECLNLLEKSTYDLILTDLKMNGIDGIELLKRIKDNDYSCEVILVTAFSTVDSAVTAMKLGAFGYFIKGQDPQILLKEVEKIFKISQLTYDNQSIKNNLMQANYLLDTQNKEFKEVLRVAEKAATSNSNILILGESGTGKEVIAKFIHQCSLRKDENFVAVNCQVFSDSLLESELFGHEKGAFTGAVEKRIGRFEEADKGTLFLDEIGEIHPHIQVKLLRAIENKSIERIGSNKKISIDLRLMSATNKDLYKNIEKGEFREDLFYRINTIIVEIPPLRERKEDIPSFIKFFLNIFKNEMKKNIDSVENSLMEILMNYDYPGNIRELKNIIERLVVLSDSNILRKKDLPIIKFKNNDNRSTKLNLRTLKDVRHNAEKNHILQVLADCRSNVSEAAKILDISRRQLYNKLYEYNIEP